MEGSKWKKEEYVTVVAMEECSEMQQALAKGIRFGFLDHHPDRPEMTNADEVLMEYYQLVAVMEELQALKVLPKITEEEIRDIKCNKREKMERFMTYSREKGHLKES